MRVKAYNKGRREAGGGRREAGGRMARSGMRDADGIGRLCGCELSS
jgi:hypothetical protein